MCRCWKAELGSDIYFLIGMGKVQRLVAQWEKCWEFLLIGLLETRCQEKL
jgi:hypothetical protein